MGQDEPDPRSGRKLHELKMGTDSDERIIGGGGGIRTRETIHHRLHALQACAFNRSATPPLPACNGITRRQRLPTRTTGCNRSGLVLYKQNQFHKITISEW
jgi:hypothetical protein